MNAGNCSAESDGTEPAFPPHATDTLDEQDGWLVISATGQPLSDDDVGALRDADQR